MKSIPMRMCVCCRKMFNKNQLIRVVRGSENIVFIDSTHKANGRGAYICTNQQCLIKCRKTKMLNKHLDAAIEDSLYQQLEEMGVKQ